MMLSISSLMMVFIQAISVVIFPMLKAEKHLNYSAFYKTIQPLVMLLLIVMLLFYYPLYLFMNAWLPQYSSSMIYLAYLFPIFIFEGKKSLLTNTFLKVIRYEKDILLANIVAVIFSLIATLIFTRIYQNLTLAVLSITFVTALSAYVSEWLLTRRMRITIIYSTFRELFVCGTFVVISSLFNIWQAILIVIVIIALYILSDFKQLKQSIKYTLSFIK
jgi:O-antigen/teichoic acid export membrane protein